MATKDSKKAPNQSVRYFELLGDKPSYFWEIQVPGDSFAVRYGKIGTAGQTQTKFLQTRLRGVVDRSF